MGGAEPPELPLPTASFHGNEVSGFTTARNVLQAHDIHGGVHLHQPPGEPAFAVTPRQLPSTPANFVNRSSEIGRLDVIVAAATPAADPAADPDTNAHAHRGESPSPVVVLTGTPGVGKTSLALHWAHGVCDRFPAGALYVNLRGHDTSLPMPPEQVLVRFLHALGVPAGAVPPELEDRAALYRSVTADRRLLVVLDNAATATQVRPLLPGASGSLTLVTSRNSLPGLVAREGAHRLDLPRFPNEEAVRLLRTVTAAHRAADLPEDLAELARLCAGLPLALRIAAERAAGRPLMVLGELIADLKDRSALWDVLTAESEEETDAMHGVFTWSYRALPPPAARQFRLLGLLPSAEFGLPAAAAVAGSTVAQARRRLDLLVGAHLVEQRAAGRYQLHDLLRAYAVDTVQRTESAQDRRDAERRALAWYLHTADNAQSVLAPFDRYPLDLAVPPEVVPLAFEDHGAAFQWYREEADNLVAATRAAADCGADDLAWRLCAMLRAVHMHQNAFEDWVTTARIGIEAAVRDGSRAGQAEAHESLGKAYFQARRLDEAESSHRVALEIRQAIGDRFGEAVSLNALGLLGLRRRRLAEARGWFEAGAAVFRELGDRRWVALALSNLAETLCELGEPAPAAAALDEALAVFRTLGDRSGEGNALFFRSWALRELGELTRALDSITAALVIADQERNSVWRAHWLAEAAQAERAAGRAEEALRSAEEAAGIQRRLGDRSRAATALDRAGEACRDLGRTELAIRLHQEAAELHRECGDAWQLSGALDNLARALRQTGEHDAARSHWREALSLLTRFEDSRATARDRQIRRELTDPQNLTDPPDLTDPQGPTDPRNRPPEPTP
ncbi:ATP-binding protein [Kitasatospora viridis]|uniref:Tetratricopeptide repeat protein n=1 Tax=Kitasatospora viridis TaxID=281105 RepID=A0A561SF25_9ACTN|nr:tetratricopeptide repeat protein [Kitasatospora viridis]TWF73418.1 tetratricopeptide repeat protein [Kitasatospora viridis]